MNEKQPQIDLDLITQLFDKILPFLKNVIVPRWRQLIAWTIVAVVLTAVSLYLGVNYPIPSPPDFTSPLEVVDEVVTLGTTHFSNLEAEDITATRDLTVDDNAVIGGNLSVSGTMSFDCTSATITDSLTLLGELTLTRTPTDDSYIEMIDAEWTAGADMTAGGSNGIYSIANAVEDVQNAYALRGRMDLRDADSEGIAVNQLHSVDALINLSNQIYTVVDNISVYGAAIHSVGITAGDVIAEGATGGSLNLYYGVWGDTTTEEFTVGTNGMQILTHANTNLDYGLNVSNSGDMDAGLLLDNHASNSPATMDVGVEMVSAGDKMVNGINMSAASFSGQDIVFQNGTGLSEETDTVLTFSEFMAAAEQAAVVVTSGSTITPTGTYQPLTSTGAQTTSTSEAIADGTVIGQLLILVNENASSAITIDDGGNTKLSGDAVLGADDTLMLIWDGADWLEIAQSDNT